MTKQHLYSSPPDAFDPDALLGILKSLLLSLPQESVDASAILGTKLKQLQRNIELAIERLQNVLMELDPIKQPPHVLDPSDPEVVGRLIADTLLMQEIRPLDILHRFYGSGVYAIYYQGAFDAYQPIERTQTPIYNGKADPAEAQAKTPLEQGTRLWNRLNDHRRSISAAENLTLSDFECRFLVVRSAWQNTAENYLIQKFRPIWNNEMKICYGFGKHGDDPATRGNTRSPWDTIHPGRKWALKAGNVPSQHTVDQIKHQISEHFKKHPPLTYTERIL